MSLEGLVLSGGVHDSPFKGTGFSTGLGTYKGTGVVVKSGDQRLAREAAILLSVSYRGIQQVIELEKSSASYQLVLEMLPGIGLAEYINLDKSWHSKTLELAEATAVVDGLALCFQALLKADYLYRDLNLNHVILNGSEISLVDVEWSVGKDLEGVWRVDSLGGTWETMAHEEFRVGNPMTVMSSTYTLGVVLLQLVSGGNPFHVDPISTPNSEVRRFKTRNWC